MIQKKHLCLILLLCVAFFASAENKKNNRPTSYNYLRGVEAVHNENKEEAIDYFNRDLQENPKNGYSFSWIAMLRNTEKDYGRALTAANMAIKLIPKKDVEYVTFAYSTRADVYLNLGDTVKALSDLTTAIKVAPDDCDLYDKRAQVYFELEKYDLADADYLKMVEIDPGDIMGHMGLGRNANAQKRWDDAIKHFDHVTKLMSDYSSGYSFRAEAYIAKEKWVEATDDIIKALAIDWDSKALYLATTLKDPAFSMLASKIKVQAAKQPHEATWPYILGIIYDQNNLLEKAIECYKSALDKDLSPTFYYRMSMCQYELGKYHDALNSINQALSLDSTVVSYNALKAEFFYEMGDIQSAISEWDYVLTTQPDYEFGYYRRGWYKDMSGDPEGAVEDLSMSIVLDPDYTYSYMTRADIYMKQNKTELAVADYKKIIEIEDSPEKYECIPYAFLGLGEKEKAIAAIERIILKDTTDAGNYYDAACLYSRMKDKANALKYLEKSLELGFRRFAHIEQDDDMDFLRETNEFKELIMKYKSSWKSTTNEQNNATAKKEAVIIEVPFTKEDGICKVKCQINGLPLHFVFDTGASDVTISMVEATFMMKNGYLSKNDVIGSQKYIDANGNVSVGTVFIIKKVNFGGLELNNIRASVVRNQKAPLLLGQSVLARLGKIEIDNSKNVLKITQ